MAEEIEKSWYTKYRPKNMVEYSGNHIRNIVEKRFSKRENMPHVIMLQGNRGCGKTTFARIISKHYLCQNFTESGPCGCCEMCESIDEILIGGQSSEVECPGVTEVDATIMNGKEAIQGVLDEALQRPIYSDFKVLIVDECHMISNAGQNSMLKIIEDIPPHLIVIFATTDPQKVLQTIKSRCQLTMEVKKQTIPDMVNRLIHISEMEGLTVSKEALEVIVKKADRVPRESINLLESIAKSYDKVINMDNVRDYLGDVASDIYLEYFKAANESLASVLMFIHKIKEKDVKYRNFVSGLMQFALDSMYIKHGINLEDYPKEYIKQVKELFDMYTSSDFDMLLQVLEYTVNNLAYDDDSRNSVLLVTTAMRISKISLLANGLGTEHKEAIAENKLSLVEHSKKLKANRDTISEKLKMDLSLEAITESFNDVKVVENASGLFDGIVVPELKPIEQDDTNNNEESENNNSSIDDFFSM